MLKPRLKSTVLLSPIVDGYVAYDTDTDRLHRLNSTASLIIELCDGTREIEQIESSVRALLPKDHTSALREWVSEALENNLLVSSQGKPAKHDSLSADQLAKLADRLRERGKIQTAYLCQKQAAELKPGCASKWADLGELAHIAGQREEARNSYEHYLTIQPDDAEVQHILVALRDESPPSRMPDKCIQQLYERFSSFYDSNLIEELEYVVPEKLSEAIEMVFPGRTDLKILDLGCGTGLSGERLRERAGTLDGIDLSSEMISLARKRNLYNSLEVAEITSWLSAAGQSIHEDEVRRYDLIVACDTLIYFGDLSQVIQPASQFLKRGGAIAFSVERCEQPGYELTDSGRYAHHATYIKEVAHAAGLNCAVHREEFLRMEYGEEVMGHIVVLNNRDS
ncbi:MAG: methyltransferase domain-containing protein [Planctomycetes bacterium]|nr:methyltransferase domain-containing protein [Planctomycetota bacterium]MCH9724254.1 methyltransferase domain-containing protein [Planctomycetota bacterium]MCH9778965.1 methyltransferase domain-containing protein [Planctomycetota bacterium]MCH9792145.1 methyltransferase domain-containing protein [Planctomycetota bacterium]